MAYIKTEEVSAIRNELKKRFGHTGLKFGVRKEHHSSVHVTIKAGPIDFSDIYKDHYGSGDHYAQINPYHLSNYGQHQPLFEEIIKIIKTAPALAEGGREWFDKSDVMSDYFHTAFYINLDVGSYDKPYVHNGWKLKPGMVLKLTPDMEVK